MAVPRAELASAWLPDGRVVVAGGENGTGLLSSGEVFNPATNTWSPTTGGIGAPRKAAKAVLLPRGWVLLVGGVESTGASSEVDVLDAANLTWSSRPSLSVGRADAVVALLWNGTVLVAGGAADTSTELFDPLTNQWSPGPVWTGARSNAMAIILPTGELLTVGGETPTGVTAAADLYDEGRRAQAAFQPTLLTSARVRRGSTETLSGANLTGIGEASGGTNQTSPTNFPIIQMRREDDAWAVALSSQWTPTSTSVAYPATAEPGWYWIRAVVSGVPSRARPVRVGYADLEPCCSDDQCGSGRCCAGVCSSAVCANTDAGLPAFCPVELPDAGTPDAGAPDAGEPTDAGTPPILDAGVWPNALCGTPFAHQVTIEGTEPFSVTGPDGLTIDAAGGLTWVPTREQAGVHAIVVHRGALRLPMELTVSCPDLTPVKVGCSATGASPWALLAIAVFQVRGIWTRRGRLGRAAEARRPKAPM
jgi:hypothetical protein